MNVSRQAMYLLLVGLLAVQALPVAHAFGHPVLEHADHVCMICTHGQTADDMLPTAAVAMPTWHGAAFVPEMVVPAALQPAPRPSRIRDPPPATPVFKTIE